MGAHSLTGGLLSSGLGSRREMQIQVEDPSLSGTGRGLWLEPMVLGSSPSQTVKGSRSITCSHLEAAEGARAVVLPREAVGRPSKASASGQQGSRRRGWEAALLLEKTPLPPRPGRTRLLARSASNGSLRLSCPERSLPGDHFPGSQFS